MSKNGWITFVFRSPKASSYQNLTSASAVISKVIDDYQDSSTENALCEEGNPENTALEVFKAIKKICNTVSLCAVLPFNNLGVAQVRNLQVEPYSLCNSMEFQGFNFIAGLNLDKKAEEKVDEEDGDEEDWKELEKELKVFLSGNEVKLEIHEDEEGAAEDSTTPTTRVSVEKSPVDVHSNREEIIHKLNYTKDLEHISYTGSTPDPELMNIKSTPGSLRSANVMYSNDEERSVNFSVGFVLNYFLICFILILKLL